VTRERRRLAGWLGGVLAAAVVVVGWVRFLPIDPALLDRSKHQSITVLDRNGEILYESMPSTGARSEWLTHAPAHIANATIAAEDKRFRSHLGVDPLAITRAAWRNVKAMRVVEGGSTITQQCAKLLLQAPSRGFTTKMREAILAQRLEQRFTKDEILALYLNLAPYGNRMHGVARASRVYFGVGPEQLTPAQAAFLASLPQRPSAFNPLRNPNKARARQRHILANMNLRADELAQAKAEKLQFRTTAQPALAMHFVERLLHHPEQSEGSQDARSLPPEILRSAQDDGRLIRTTLDAPLQRDVLGIIEAHRHTLLKHGAHSVAVAVLDNKSGAWLAWEGSGDYFGTTFGGAIDGVVTARQPGSTLKPFTYALAFESGHSPASVLPDVPSHFPTAEDGVVYTPRNYDDRYRGPLLVRSALAGSQNVPAVAMLAKLGPESLLRLLRNSGFTGLDHTSDYYGLGLTLGDAEVTLEQLVRAYSVFARGGKSQTPDARRLFSERTAFWITDILSDNAAREYAFGAGGSLELPFPVAVKTGTSQAYHDNWTVGYTRDLTVGVWVGNFDRRPLRGSSGVTGAAPIFNAVMLAAVKRTRGTLPIGDTSAILEPPANIEQIEICTLSGARPSTYCPATRKEWLATNAPARFCSWHHDGAIDWPAEYRAWARKNAPSTQRAQTIHRAAFKIANPPDGATYLIDPTLRREFQTLRLRADSATKVAWRINGQPIGDEWPLARGRHVIEARDASGKRDAVKIFVK
jgi:penicillin-binding protein 1C